MVKINTELVDDGLGTVGEVQSYAQSVLDSIGDVVSAGNAIDTALFSTQDIVDVNMNVTGKLLPFLLYFSILLFSLVYLGLYSVICLFNYSTSAI